MTSWHGCDVRTSSCGWSATSSPSCCLVRTRTGTIPSGSSVMSAHRVFLAVMARCSACRRLAFMLRRRPASAHAVADAALLTDPHDPWWITRDLWRAAGACLAPGRRGAWAQTHARLMRAAVRRQPPARHDRYHTADRSRPAPTVDRDSLLPAEPALGCRHHLRADASGFLYLAVVLDASARSGWSMATICDRTGADALEMAIASAPEASSIIAPGSQYTSWLANVARRLASGLMGSVGDTYDNATRELLPTLSNC